MNPCIVIPTLNESENLPTLIRIIKYVHADIPIIIVDDNSPDGTGEIADRLAGEYENIFVIHRKTRIGIGAAIIDGFELALQKKFDPVITMDADLSHSPFYLKKFLKYSQNNDLLIGSRYIRGLRVEGWRFRKVLLSKLANMYVSYVMVKPIWDFTSGYRVYSASFLRKLSFEGIPPQGYLFQIHMIYLAYKFKMRVKEIAFVFKDVEIPTSKFSSQERWLTFRKVWNYRAPYLEIIRHFTYIRKDYRRFVEEYEELLNPPPLKNNGKFLIQDKFTVSIGIMAYNEEKNIVGCLESLLQQKCTLACIEEIMVVSSGSTDRTNEIVRKFQKDYPFVKLIVQRERKGKASAINEFLKYAEGDICVLESADTIAQPHTIEELVKPLFNPKVGIVGAHPIPMNSKKKLIGFCVHKLWRLHHRMAMEHAKCGEMIAFRNIITKIPSYTAVDEAVIESILREVGFEIRYAPNAIVVNKGPENMRDFLKQRKRIDLGHKHLSATRGYKVATLKTVSIFKHVLAELSWSPIQMFYMLMLIGIEAYSRILGTINFHLRDKNPFIWEIATSTKELKNQN
jgi:glycosyltransferase involved in cell wall biosynthesis